MRAGKIPLAVLLLTLAAGLARAEGDPVRGAMACSNDALRRYATTSPDPAPAIAKVAFDACQKEWNAAIAALLARDGFVGMGPWLNRDGNDWLRSKPRHIQEEFFRLHSWSAYLKGFEEAYAAQATRAVFELRARAASPAPKKAPGARDY